MMLQTVEQAHDKAAALGKALYSQLFLWLVAKLNTTISAPQRYALLHVYQCFTFGSSSCYARARHCQHRGYDRHVP